MSCAQPPGERSIRTAERRIQRMSILAVMHDVMISVSSHQLSNRERRAASLCAVPELKCGEDGARDDLLQRILRARRLQLLDGSLHRMAHLAEKKNNPSSTCEWSCLAGEAGGEWQLRLRRSSNTSAQRTHWSRPAGFPHVQPSLGVCKLVRFCNRHALGSHHGWGRPGWACVHTPASPVLSLEGAERVSMATSKSELTAVLTSHAVGHACDPPHATHRPTRAP